MSRQSSFCLDYIELDRIGFKRLQKQKITTTTKKTRQATITKLNCARTQA